MNMSIQEAFNIVSQIVEPDFKHTTESGYHAFIALTKIRESLILLEEIQSAKDKTDFK